MASAGHRRETARLTGQAKDCETQLIRLRQHARGNKVTRRTDATKRFLDDFIERITTSISLLESWISAVSKGLQTSNNDVLDSTEGYFKLLKKNIAAARKALDVWLKIKRVYLYVPWPRKKNPRQKANDKIDEALTNIAEVIGSLQTQIDTVIVETQEQQKRRSKINEVNRAEYYKVFMEDFLRMSSMERRTLRFGMLPSLWNEFPPRPPWADNPGSADDPGDGLIQSKKSIDRVTLILKALYDAWSDSTVQSNPIKSSTLPKVATLTEMPKICLVLWGMKQERLLDHFFEHDTRDTDLPLDVSRLQKILPEEDAYHAIVFSTEQYRAKPRQWEDNQHIKIPEEEPLSLEKLNEYGSGSYGTVTGCQCKVTLKRYARKEGRTPEARRHLQREVDRLKLLGHRHIVQYVKSYERGETYSILLRPVATTDLKKLLGRYDRNGYNYADDGQSRVRDRTIFRPIILTSFGCLSLAMAQIHSRNIRHKDIKPENILYQKALKNEPARFLWADFGLAHYFAQGEGSKTLTNMEHYSKKYAAPESVQADLLSTLTQQADKDQTHLSAATVDYEGASHEGSSDASKTSKSAGTARNRSSDIFSFGCVFLETLSHLVNEMRGKRDREEFDSYAPFYENINELIKWADEEIKHLEPASELKLLFEIGKEMIAPEPGDRPKIHQIVHRLRHTNNASIYFCTKCWEGKGKEDQIIFQHDSNEHPPLQVQPSPSESIRQAQADPEVKENALAGLGLTQPPPEREPELLVPAESSSAAAQRPQTGLHRSAIRQPGPAVELDRPRNRPRFQEPVGDDEDLSLEKMHI